MAVSAWRRQVDSKGDVMRKLFWAALGYLAVAQAQAASFDCAKAKNSVEKVICADADLSRIDEDMSTAYHHALDRIQPT